MMSKRHFIRIMVMDNGSNPFRAVTSINRIYDKSSNIRQDLSFIENDYSLLIGLINNLRSIMAKEKKRDPRLFWLIGDSIAGFLKRIDNMGFYLDRQTSTLSRDTNMSESTIRRIMAFWRQFPSISSIDPSISWTKYVRGQSTKYKKDAQQ